MISVRSSLFFDEPCVRRPFRFARFYVQDVRAHQAEIVALRHKIAILQRSSPRHLRLKQSERLLWILLSRF